MPSLHDNIILSYEVDLENGRIKMRTRSSHDVPKNMDVLFSGVMAHSFDTPLHGSIIFDLDERDLKHFIPYNRELLESGKGQGWPVSYESYDELQIRLIKEKYKYMVISSSYGLSGWVLAKSVEIQCN
ncbi:hypothetical protein [Paenibacillus sp. 1781tsa1]|uniref:hypothetical protein n=1 Tax=Paenibacillus sp. 1781tsa1 TaxID=2953810 RepID=UPI0020A09EF9|nr:hypothetical protein [Paenibacillus sp. 1781tsa1]MCP1182990.1 hypothetical protein [Paenibacillus sp. 1781tsa1]